MTYAIAMFEAATPYGVGEVHLHENTLFDIDPGVKVTQDITQYPLHHVTYSDTKFEVATSNSLEGDAFTSKYIIFNLTLDQGHAKCCEYPLHHEIYSGTKFEVATFNGLGGGAFTKKTLFDC